MLKPNDEVVRPTNHNNVPFCFQGEAVTSPSPSPPPRLYTQDFVTPEACKDVVKIDVCKEGANAPTLRCTGLGPMSLPIFQHTRFQPFLDESQNALVSNSVLKKP